MEKMTGEEKQAAKRLISAISDCYDAAGNCSCPHKYAAAHAAYIAAQNELWEAVVKKKEKK